MRAPAILMGASYTLAVQRIRSMPWIARFFGAGSLAHPVERCIPALVVCLYSALFGIEQIMVLGSMTFSTVECVHTVPTDTVLCREKYSAETKVLSRPK